MILSIVSHKGGTGKTTTTINLGSALASIGKRVLLIDFDAQGSLSYSLGIAAVPTVADVLVGDCSIHHAVQVREGMDVLPADRGLADVELAIAKSDLRFVHLSRLLASLPEYDFILIDCPPSLSMLTLNALAASEFVLIPMQFDVLALRGLDSMLDTVKKMQEVNNNLNVLGVLPIMVDTRKNIFREIQEHLRTNYTVHIFTSAIRPSVKAAEAPSFSKSVLAYAPGSTTSHDYLSLADEIVAIKNAHAITVPKPLTEHDGTWRKP